MVEFQVADMTCGHCVSVVTKAVKDVDENATVDIELAQHLVRIESASTDVTELESAIREAGYTPVVTSDAAV